MPRVVAVCRIGANRQRLLRFLPFCHVPHVCGMQHLKDFSISGLFHSKFFDFSGTSPEKVEAIKGEVDTFIKDNPVAIFSKTYCQYCMRAKGVLDSANIRYKALELDIRSDGRAVQKYLAQRAGGRSNITVPQVYVGGTLIGGSDELIIAQRDGSLNKMLQSAASGQSSPPTT